jgi:beta-lactam-binding protein with PASTA domain
MPAVGKEIERLVTPEVETQPVEQMGYVERTEKQVETKLPTGTTSQQVLSRDSDPAKDMGKIVSAQFAIQTKPNIMLPMSQEEVVGGLHQKIWKGVRWASEWCVMMIKKYPGRVFYLSPEKK